MFTLGDVCEQAILLKRITDGDLGAMGLKLLGDFCKFLEKKLF